MRVTAAPIDFSFQDRDSQRTVNSAWNCTSVATYMLVLIAESKELTQTELLHFVYIIV
jgi:hypothetical protein